eukprot:SAG11_NODE_19553_length_464_cov_0.805479_1_plen_154_part_11
MLKNLGPQWTTDFIGMNDDDVARVESRILLVMKKVLDKPRARAMKKLAEELYNKWKPEPHAPHFYRGKQVTARAQHPAAPQIHPDFPGWYAGRIVGPGKIPRTYEILFDRTEEDGDDIGVESTDDDRHTFVFPYFDSINDQAFLRGERLGNKVQ